MKNGLVFSSVVAAASLSLLVLSVAPACAQGNDLRELLTAPGEANAPKTLKDLTGDWRRIAVRADARGGDDTMNQLMKLMALGGNSGSGSEAASAMLGMSMLGGMFGGGGMPGASGGATIYYTQGRIATLGGETFLVAYQYLRKEPNLMQMIMESERNGGKEPDFEKILADSKVTGDTPLSLVLLNARSLGSISGIRAFDLATELADAASSGGGPLLELMAAEAKKKGNSGSSGGAYAEPVEDGPDPVAIALTSVPSVLDNLKSDPTLRAARVQITVEARGASLVLKGTAPNARLQARAANIARQSLGDAARSVRVVNQITVKP